MLLSLFLKIAEYFGIEKDDGIVEVLGGGEVVFESKGDLHIRLEVHVLCLVLSVDLDVVGTLAHSCHKIRRK